MLATGGQLSLEFAPDATYGWGAAVRNTYPFSRHAATMEDPEQLESGKLEGLLNECARRLPSGAALALNSDYSAPENDPHTRWTKRRYADEFPLLMGLLVRHGLADTDTMPARGNTKTRLRLKESMETVRDGVLGGESRFADLSKDLREAIPT